MSHLRSINLYDFSCIWRYIFEYMKNIFGFSKVWDAPLRMERTFSLNNLSDLFLSHQFILLRIFISIWPERLQRKQDAL